MSNKEMKEKEETYTATFFGKRYKQLERLSKNRKSKLYVITKTL